MRRYLVRVGISAKNVLKGVLSGVGIVLAGLALQGGTAWTELSLVEGYSKVFFVSIGAVLIPLIYCTLQRKETRKSMESIVATRYDCRLSWAESVIAGCFIRAAMFTLYVNVLAIGTLLALGCYITNWGWMITLSMLLQILFLFNLSVLQILVQAYRFSTQIAFASAVLYGAFDFVALNTMMEPFYIGWGTILWWRRPPIHILCLPILTVFLIIALETTLCRTDRLDLKRE